jgi:hypothetical protein
VPDSIYLYVYKVQKGRKSTYRLVYKRGGIAFGGNVKDPIETRLRFLEEGADLFISRRSTILSTVRNHARLDTLNDQALLAALHDFWDILESYIPMIFQRVENPDSASRFSLQAVSTVPVLPPNITRDRFIFDEPSTVQEGVDPMLLGRATKYYWLNWLTQHAFMDACQSFPRLSENSISNVIEIVQFIYNLVIKHQIEIPQSLSQAWLSYRYQFSTSSLDAREAIEFVHRRMDIGDISKGISCYGAAFHEVEGRLVTCRCSIEMAPREIGFVDSIWRALYTYGLSPNFYIIWDMIPYSFIVDWFIPIGDILGVVDAQSAYSSDKYDFKHICYSLSYDNEANGMITHQYVRWKGSAPPQINALYWFDSPSASNKTVAFRVLDSLSLVIGH